MVARVASFAWLVSAACADSAKASSVDTFAAWAAFHRKIYESQVVEEQRRATFWNNAKLVDTLNRDGDGAVYSLDGPFADLAPEEFEARLMPKRPVPEEVFAVAREHNDPALLRVGGLPESFDWVDKGAVAPVRDQQALGSCWAISTAENIEGQHFIANGKLVPMSPQQLVECDASVDESCHGEKGQSKLGCADCGMFGGWPYMGYQFLQKAGGMFSEADWPYWHEGVYSCMPKGYSKLQCGNHDDLFCNPNTTKGQGPGGLCKASSGFATSVTGWKALSMNETELAAQVVQYGPLSVLIDADGLQNYHSGIWKGGLFGCKPDPTKGILGLDHAVLLVGFGVEHGAFGKQTPYWKLKNSWGTKWGEQGFFRLERGTASCGINHGPGWRCGAERVGGLNGCHVGALYLQ